MPARTATAALAAATLVGITASHADAQTYHITPIGLTGTGYTLDDGVQESRFTAYTASGQAGGYSNRYSGMSYFGRDSWVWDGANTVQVGLIGDGYTYTDGGRQSYLEAMNAAGQAVGFSERLSGTTYLGHDTWVWDGAVTRQVGLTGSGYTRTDGYQYSDARLINTAGQVAGYSERYSGSTGLGRDAWVSTGSATVQVGLTGTGYVRSDGYRSSVVQSLNDAGQLAGQSERYSGSTFLGRDAWVLSGTTTQQVGLVGSEYTNGSSGYRSSSVQFLNNAGQAAGYSERPAGGGATWVWDGTDTVQVGLIGTGYVRPFDGYKYSEVRSFNGAGQAAGYSYRYSSGSSFLGQDAWVSTGSATAQVGLTGAGYVRTDGYRYSSAESLNESGFARGSSQRFSGMTNIGEDAWLWDGSITVRVGLTGTDYTRTDGYAFNRAVYLNNTGHLAGYAERYSGTTYLGRDAWVYDSDTGLTTGINLSIRSDGYAYSNISYLADDGSAYGTYTLFSGSTNAGNRAFAYTASGGAVDLGLQVEGGLSAAGWQYLAEAFRSSGGTIFGYGLLTGMPGGQAAFAMTPVPEPGTVLGVAAAGLGLAGWVRRRKTAAA